MVSTEPGQKTYTDFKTLLPIQCSKELCTNKTYHDKKSNKKFIISQLYGYNVHWLTKHLTPATIVYLSNNLCIISINACICCCCCVCKIFSAKSFCCSCCNFSSFSFKSASLSRASLIAWAFSLR